MPIILRFRCALNYYDNARSRTQVPRSIRRQHETMSVSDRSSASTSDWPHVTQRLTTD
jgi:hypothetical protein